MRLEPGLWRRGELVLHSVIGGLGGPLPAVRNGGTVLAPKGSVGAFPIRLDPTCVCVQEPTVCGAPHPGQPFGYTSLLGLFKATLLPSQSLGSDM